MNILGPSLTFFIDLYSEATVLPPLITVIKLQFGGTSCMRIGGVCKLRGKENNLEVPITC